MKTIHLLLMMVFSLPLFFSCNKKEVKTSPVEFYLMDTPNNYDSVNIHIKKIEAEVVGDSTIWIPVHTKDTIVNLFHLQDSITMQVANDVVPFGVLKQIHFILGYDNTVYIKGIAHPLQLINNDTNVLTIEVNKKLNEVFNGFILDFDASESIVEDSDGYKLKPVVRLLQ